MLNIENHRGVVVVELDHGKVNALDLELLLALTGAFRDADADQPIVLTGAGRAFSAGVDLRRIGDGDHTYAREFLVALSESFLAVFDHPGPVVAAINGAAIAGGCVLAAACDRRLMSQGLIGLAEIAVGVPFPISALEIMRSVLGPRTGDLVLTARNLAPAEALAVGLVDEVTDADRLRVRAIEQAAAFGALPPGVFAYTKRQLHGPARERITAAGAAPHDAQLAQLWTSNGVQQAITRYLNELSRRGRSS